jgi:hypothetical protein
MPQQEGPGRRGPGYRDAGYLDLLRGGYREYGATRYRRLVPGRSGRLAGPLLQPPAWPGSMCRRARVTVASSPAAEAAGLKLTGAA